MGKVGKFRKHNMFGEGNSENPVIEFSDLEDLLEKTGLSDIKSKDGFSHFAVSDNCLMSIWDDGLRWWVCGYVSNPEMLGLPEWDKGRYKIVIDGEWCIIPGKWVHSVCGDDVTLADGAVVKKHRDHAAD